MASYICCGCLVVIARQSSVVIYAGFEFCVWVDGCDGHSGKMTAHAQGRLRDFRARRNGCHRIGMVRGGGGEYLNCHMIIKVYTTL